jgi:nucleoside diphosphate kinase
MDYWKIVEKLKCMTQKEVNAFYETEEGKELEKEWYRQIIQYITNDD